MVTILFGYNIKEYCYSVLKRKFIACGIDTMKAKMSVDFLTITINWNIKASKAATTKKIE